MRTSRQRVKNSALSQSTADLDETDGPARRSLIPAEHVLASIAGPGSCLLGRGPNWAELIEDRIGNWASAYFDEGQALWPMTSGKSSLVILAELGTARPHAGNRSACRAFAKRVQALPESPDVFILQACESLKVPSEHLGDYFPPASARSWGLEPAGPLPPVGRRTEMNSPTGRCATCWLSALSGMLRFSTNTWNEISEAMVCCLGKLGSMPPVARVLLNRTCCFTRPLSVQ
jgi:hypothetical protein